MKKVHSFIMRMAALLVPAALLVSYSVVPASASSVSGVVTFTSYMHRSLDYTPSSISSKKSIDLSLPIDSLYSSDFSSTDSDYTYYSVGYPFKISYSSFDSFTGTVGFYFTFYYLWYSSSQSLIRDLNIENCNLYYTDSYGVLCSVPADIESFSVDSVGATTGYRVSADITGAEYDSVSNIYFEFELTDINNTFAYSKIAVTPGYRIFVPSASVITTVSSAELSQLQNVANGLAAQNDLLNAMYGDVMMLLNAIWERQGSIIETERIANAYLLAIANHLSSIKTYTVSIYDLLAAYLHYLENISLTADDIYSELESFHEDFISKLDLLISTVSAESDDIQAKMEEIYDMLIAYLDSSFSNAVNPGSAETNQDFSDAIDQSESLETPHFDSLTEAWNRLDESNYNIFDTFAGAMMWVSSWFSNILNSFGAYSVVLLFPLLLGLYLLLIGRLSRHSIDVSRFRGGKKND